MRLIRADAVEHDIGAAAARQLAHGGDRAAAVEQLARAELRGETATP